MTRDEVWTFARDWVDAWNAHDLDAIMSHYGDSVELTSPVAGGSIAGKQDLRAYFQRGLEAWPDLRFDLEDVLWGMASIVLYYRNHRGTRTAEFMEFGDGGKVSRVVANYSG